MARSVGQERLYGQHRAVCSSGDWARPTSATSPNLAASELELDLVHQHTTDHEAQQLAELEHALSSACECMSSAYSREQPWVDRVRASLAALLKLFDQEPRVAELCVIDSTTVARGADARRQATLGVVARAIDEGRELCRGDGPSSFTADVVLAGTLGAIHGRLVQPDAGPLTELLNPLMSFIVMPYGGVAAARHELSRSV